MGVVWSDEIKCFNNLSIYSYRFIVLHPAELTDEILNLVGLGILRVCFLVFNEFAIKPDFVAGVVNILQ